MDLSLSADQQSLLTATAEWCRDNMKLEAARTRPAGLWRDLEAMGWTGMTAGAGFDHATETLIFAELGRHLAPVGLIATAVGSRWAGEGRYALAVPSETSLRVFDPGEAAAAIGLWHGKAGLVMIPGSLQAEPGLDLSAPVTTLDIAPIPNAIDDPRVALHFQLLSAAYAVGCADAARDMGAAYAKIREQFERPIGWFQAIKHVCADMAVRCEVARAQLYFAACAFDAGDADAKFHAAAAKRLADQAALENGRADVQVHGGIGMTDEAYPHLCLKRAHLLSFIAPVTRDALLGETV